jgi:hypothetical protein
MALPSITMADGYLLVIEKESKGGLIVNNNLLLFGEVAAISATTTFYNVGDMVGYNPVVVKIFLFDDTIYYVLAESDVYFIEN